MVEENENDVLKEAIQRVIKTMMERVMRRVLVEDPFLKEKHRAEKPLYAALVPDEIFKGSHFERRFVTPFGSAWELLAMETAKIKAGHAIKGHLIQGNVKAERLRRIQEILNRLEHPAQGQQRVKPNWDAELSFILEGGGEDIPVPIVCDVYVEDARNNQRYAFELKAPLPNSDITKVSKEKILKLHAMEPKQVDGAYFALPYNPYGLKENYAWSFPNRWFDMRHDSAVLIGEEFWEKLGGVGTYRAFIEAVNEIGEEYRRRIYREFLQIEPPANAEENKL